MRSRPFLFTTCLTAAGIILASSGGVEFRINAYALRDQRSPVIAADEAGNFVAVWVSERQDGELTGIFGRLFTKSGVPRSPEFQVNEYWEHLQDRPAVAMGGDGGFIIAWTSHGHPEEDFVGISARVFDRNGNPKGPEFVVNTLTPDHQDAPAVSSDRQGRYVVAWEDWGRDGDSFGIFARLFDRNGVPLGQEFQVNAYFSNDQINPSCVMDGEGNLIIAWESWGQDGDKSGIYLRRFSRQGTPLGPESRVNFTKIGWQSRPSLTVDPSGGFVVCWDDFRYTSEDYDVYARILDRNADPITPEFRVNTQVVGRQVYPSVHAAKDGSFLVVWQGRESESGTFDIFSRLFAPNGTSTEPELIVNETVAGTQEMPKGIIIASNHYIVAWQSLAKKDDGWDVFGRIFENRLQAPEGLFREKTRPLGHKDR